MREIKRENIIVGDDAEIPPKEEILEYTEDKRDGVKAFYESVRAENKRGEIEDSPDMEKIPEYFWVAISDTGEVIGTVGLDDFEGSVGYISKMFTKKELRGKGVGSRLITALVEFAKQNGYKILFLATFDRNVRAHSFYESNGFHKTKTPPPTSLRFHDGTTFLQMDLEKQ